MTAGHMRERSTGSWELRAYAGRDPRTGRKKYRTSTFRGGKREAAKALAAFVASVDTDVVSTSGTVGELFDQWYAVASTSWSPNSIRMNRWILNGYLAGLRPHRLDRLKTATIDAYYAALRSHGGACQLDEPCTDRPCAHGRPLDPATVRRAHGVLTLALDQAVTWDWIGTNPAQRAKPGRAVAKEIQSPEAEDVIRLLEVAERMDIEWLVFLVVAAWAGARRGEVCALWWSDIAEDEITFEYVMALGDDGPVRVRKDSRQKGKPRTVAMDPATAAILSAHRARCAERALAGGVSLPKNAYVFSAAADGSRPWRPDTWSHRFARLREEAGLPGVRLHDLRHFVVTELRSAGMDDKTIMGRVGHRSANSMERYSHFKKAPDRAAAEILATLLRLPSADVV